MITTLKGSLSGQTCLITGGNSGVGKATATAFAKNGANVILVCREPARGEAARLEIIAASGNSQVDVLVADLASQKSIRQLVEQFTRKYEYLNVLVNNAAVIQTQKLITPEGIETTFATNHLGPFLLTRLLFPSLLEGAIKLNRVSRIINVAALTFRGVKPDFDNLQGEKGYNGSRAYIWSKLENVLFTYELARRLAKAELDTKVIVNALHPGIIRTSLARNYPFPVGSIINLLLGFVAKTPQHPADDILYMASSELTNQNGLYFSNKKPIRSSPESYDEQLARGLWDISNRLTNLEENSSIRRSSPASDIFA
jgi:NAD(P)-dependent dehydrogenase (short-subunit alcohol dehydrogenase family)